MTTDKNTMKPQAKKTEFLEVRLPYEDKQAFMDACKANKKTASGVLRDAIGLYLKNGHFNSEQPKYRSLIMIVSGFIVGAISMGMISSFNAATQEEHPLIDQYFALLDTNIDGEVSLNEYIAKIKSASKSDSKYKYIIGTYIYNIEANEITVKEDFTKKIISDDNLKSAKEEYCSINTFTPILQNLLFGTLDTDFNGSLTKTEFKNSPTITSMTSLQTEFHSFDKNNDIGISIEEFSTEFKEVRKDDFFQEHQTLYSFPYPASCWYPDIVLDENHVATINLVKHTRMLTKLDTDEQITYLFNQVDTNGDRSIDYSEYLGYFIPSP